MIPIWGMPFNGLVGLAFTVGVLGFSGGSLGIAELPRKPARCNLVVEPIFEININGSTVKLLNHCPKSSESVVEETFETGEDTIEYLEQLKDHIVVVTETDPDVTIKEIEKQLPKIKVMRCNCTREIGEF